MSQKYFSLCDKVLSFLYVFDVLK